MIHVLVHLLERNVQVSLENLRTFTLLYYI